VKRVNVQTQPVEYDESDPEGCKAGMSRFGPSIGASMLGASIYELPPGQAICPYHYEYAEEEWLLVLEGTPSLRHPGGTDELREGDIVAFVEGPDGAHQVSNLSDADARVLMWANLSDTGAVVYPDSDKISINPKDRRDHIIVKRASAVDYWVDET
jgi:uncharacterized cupin superfamily protein